MKRNDPENKSLRPTQSKKHPTSKLQQKLPFSHLLSKKKPFPLYSLRILQSIIVMLLVQKTYLLLHSPTKLYTTRLNYYAACQLHRKNLFLILEEASLLHCQLVFEYFCLLCQTLAGSQAPDITTIICMLYYKSRIWISFALRAIIHVQKQFLMGSIIVETNNLSCCRFITEFFLACALQN